MKKQAGKAGIQNTGLFLTHDRIYLFNSKNTFLDLTVGKKWVDESYTDETTNTMAYYAR